LRCASATRPTSRSIARANSPQEIGSLAPQAPTGAVQANLSGGEALVRRDLRRSSPSVATPASWSASASGGLTPDRFASLAAAGLDVVILSIDSADPDGTTPIAGAGAHQNALATIERARALGVVRW
jgi:molybdenum cofactor biosynthesis enzyme MoaA